MTNEKDTEYELGKAGQELQKEIKDFLQRHGSQTSNDKLGIVRMEAAAQTQTLDDSAPRYMIKLAFVLERMKQGEDIEDWFVVPRSHKLDKMQVDFIVIRVDGKVVPVQDTSTPKKGTDHRTKIRKMYPENKQEKPLIIVIQHRYTNPGSNNQTTEIDDEELFSRTLELIQIARGFSR